MKRIRFIQGLTISLLLPSFTSFSVQAADSPSNKITQEFLTALKQGGYVIVFRHGATNRNQADTDPFNHSNISKQRLLTIEGKQQAQQIGMAWKKLGIPLDKVYTSKFHRAIETGQLISGRSVISSIDITEGGLVVTPIENERRAKSLITMASTPPPIGTNTLIVTHKPNIVDAFGKDWLEIKEGEASIFKPDGSGKLLLIDRLKAPEWIAAAAQ